MVDAKQRACDARWSPGTLDATVGHAYHSAGWDDAVKHHAEDIREWARNRAMRAAACKDDSDYETAARLDAQASALREAADAMEKQ